MAPLPLGLDPEEPDLFPDGSEPPLLRVEADHDAVERLVLFEAGRQGAPATARVDGFHATARAHQLLDIHHLLVASVLDCGDALPRNDESVLVALNDEDVVVHGQRSAPDATRDERHRDEGEEESEKGAQP